SNTVPVHGTVTLRSQPLEKAGLIFFSDQGRPVSADVSNGAYQAEVPPGDYVVSVTIPVELPPNYKEGAPMPPPKVALPEQYTTRVKTPLKATVSPGQSEPIDFDLK